MRIQIKMGIKDEAMLAVLDHLNYVEKFNPNFNGVKFRVEFGDFTCLPNPADADANACALLYEIYGIIRKYEDGGE